MEVSFLSVKLWEDFLAPFGSLPLVIVLRIGWIAMRVKAGKLVRENEWWILE